MTLEFRLSRGSNPKILTKFLDAIVGPLLEMVPNKAWTNPTSHIDDYHHKFQDSHQPMQHQSYRIQDHPYGETESLETLDADLTQDKSLSAQFCIKNSWLEQWLQRCSNFQLYSVPTFLYCFFPLKTSLTTVLANINTINKILGECDRVELTLLFEISYVWISCICNHRRRSSSLISFDGCSLVWNHCHHRDPYLLEERSAVYSTSFDTPNHWKNGALQQVYHYALNAFFFLNHLKLILNQDICS